MMVNLVKIRPGCGGEIVRKVTLFSFATFCICMINQQIPMFIFISLIILKVTMNYLFSGYVWHEELEKNEHISLSLLV